MAPDGSKPFVSSDVELSSIGGQDTNNLSFWLQDDPSEINKGLVIGSIIANFFVVLPIAYTLYVFIKYLMILQPKAIDRKKLVMGLNVLLLKAVIIRNLAGFLMISSGSGTLLINGFIIIGTGIPLYCCVPACWYSSFKNWWRVKNNEECRERDANGVNLSRNDSNASIKTYAIN